MRQQHEEDQMLSPENYTYYQREYKNREVPTAELNKIWRKYVQQQLQKALQQACKATKSVAIRSTVLTRSERHKYAEQQYVYGNRAYYLFNEEAIPLKVFCKIRVEEGKLIYEKEDSL